MASQTKMIIITSNEDIIQQLSFNKTKNTHIIDLDNNNQINLNGKDDNHIIDLNLLAHLSELNSTTDQVFKRVLDSSDDNRSKPVKVPKKSTDLTCTICGDNAIGFNYDALSCASCKAFFRRNANQTSRKIRCLTGQDQCSVSHEVRRKCPQCRLNRCFAMGMRKDFILSEEEKQHRKKRLEQNRNLSSKRSSTSESTNSPSTSQPISNSESISQPISNLESISQASDEIDRLLMEMDKDNTDIFLDEIIDLDEVDDRSLEILSVEDWAMIETIQSSFVSIFQEEKVESSYENASDATSAFISWSQYADKIALSFIKFFRQIDEFEGLHVDDRFILIKYNLLSLFPIYKCLHYKLYKEQCHSEKNQQAIKNHGAFWMDDESNGIRELFVNSIRSLDELTEQDSALLSLLMIILLFCPGPSMNQGEPLLKDSLAVNRAQSYYTMLLWHYLVSNWNEVQACKYFTQLLAVIFHIQSGTQKFRDFVRVQFMTEDAVNRMGPLMQSVLNIS